MIMNERLDAFDLNNFDVAALTSSVRLKFCFFLVASTILRMYERDATNQFRLDIFNFL